MRLNESSVVQGAKLQLDEAIEELAAAGGGVTDARLGEAHFRLGRVCWELGGALKQDRSYAHRHWMAAAAHEGPSQVLTTLTIKAPPAVGIEPRDLGFLGFVGSSLVYKI